MFYVLFVLTMHVPFMFILNKGVPTRFSIYRIVDHKNLQMITVFSIQNSTLDGSLSIFIQQINVSI